jgi:nucleoside-diphosphate-sugar epimerase
LYAEIYGLETVALRYFNVFGPRQDPTSDYAAVVPRFVTAALEGRPSTIFGDGEQTRDFVYVHDIVRANLLAAESEGAAGTVANIAGGRRISLNALVGLIAELTGCDKRPVYAPERVGDVRDSQADVRRARDLLGFEPLTGLRDGLAETVEYFRKLQEGGAQ